MIVYEYWNTDKKSDEINLKILKIIFKIKKKTYLNFRKLEIEIFLI